MKNLQSIGISHLAYKLPKHKQTIEDLEKLNQIKSSPTILKDFGFEYCYVENNPEEFTKLLAESGNQVLSDSEINLDKIDQLFLYSGLDHQAEIKKQNLELFRYPVFELHNQLGLTNANAIAMSQQGCTGLLSSINMAASLLESGQKNAVLCVAGDYLPAESNREIMYNLMSDATAAVLVEKNATKNKIIHYYQQTQSYYWDTDKHEEELLATYFPMAQRVISQCLEQSGLKVEDIKWFVPHNVSLRSWKILAQLLEVPEEVIWHQNIKRIGHTVSCDHIINLVDMEEQGFLKKGDYLVLFTFGFGASWSCMILQH